MSLSWLQGTVGGRWDELVDGLGMLFGEVRPCHPLNAFYAETYEVGGLKVRLAHGAVEQVDASGQVVAPGRADETLIIVPQAALESISREQHRVLVQWLRGLGFKATRTDGRVDDWREDGVRLVPRQLEAAYQGGQVATRSRSHAWHETHKQVQVWTGEGVEPMVAHGSTFQIGSRQSAMLLRAYDKQAEVMAKRGEWIEPCTRFELEAHAVKGSDAAEILLNAALADDGGAQLLALMSGLVDFRQCSADEPNKSRFPRLAWWAALVDGVGRVRASCVARPRFIDVMARAFTANGKRLALLRRAFARAYPHLGDAGFEGWLRDVEHVGAEKLHQDVRSRDLLDLVEAGSDPFPVLRRGRWAVAV